MKILVIGSGGREHALVWKLAQSPNVTQIYAAPGNGGTAQVAENIPIAADNIVELVDFAKTHNIDLVVPGPELPLTLGITDALEAVGIPCFGPSKYCAQLEGSKSFAKELMAQANIPTAKYAVFSDPAQALEYIAKFDRPCVIKADGLAAGKGVIIVKNQEEGKKAITQILDDKIFGSAGNKIIIEEYLEGEEVSLLCLCDGNYAVPMPSAQDHKAINDGDQGPNTGGMGAYSPAPCLPDSNLEKIADIVIRPILKKLSESGHPYRGICYAGLMLTADGPRVLEYNARFGDPECQPLLMRMRSNLASHLLACAQGKLEQETISYTPDTALGVVLAAKGYPGQYPKNLSINGVENEQKDGVQIFHSGTRLENNELKSTGGRVLCVTALGTTLEKAREKAYDALKDVHMPESHYRTDIGAKGLKHVTNS